MLQRPPAPFALLHQIIWPPDLTMPPPTINPLVATSQCLTSQVWRDENPDKFILSAKERQNFREIYPLRKQSLLPKRCPRDNRPTLVLDLDETLIHTSFEIPPHPQQSEKVNITLLGSTKTLFVNMRPYLRTFLRMVSQWYEIVIYTASLSAYADRILDGLDPTKEIFNHRLYREHCSVFNGIYVKDLEQLGRPLNQLVFVDNYPGAYMMQPLNALPIRSFVGKADDNELVQLTKLLKILKEKEDVRPLLKRYRRYWKHMYHGVNTTEESVKQKDG